MITISIIIPTYNRAELLCRSLKSVIAQTFTDWEILVIDDLSTDNTKTMTERIISEYNLTEKLFYRLLEKKSGGAAARNVGINMSRGKFIAFLDDDDEWLPDKLQKQIDCVKNEVFGICYTGREIVRNGNTVAGFGKRYTFRQPPGDNHLKEIMKDNFIGVTSSVLIPKSVLLEIDGFDENLPCLQDYDLFIRILHSYKAIGIGEPLVRYYVESSTRHVSFTRENVQKASAYFSEKYKDSPYRNLLRKAVIIINIRKMLKSFVYAKEVIVHFIKK
ncbi:MAG: glycosyltransferase family 2 protein [Ignavibacteria bacterium]